MLVPFSMFLSGHLAVFFRGVEADCAFEPLNFIGIQIGLRHLSPLICYQANTSSSVESHLRSLPRESFSCFLFLLSSTESSFNCAAASRRLIARLILASLSGPWT